MNSQKTMGTTSAFTVATLLATTLLLTTGSPARAQTDCKADAGGITLSPGFCATVFADKLGHARHLVVAPNGTVYVNTWSGVYFHNDTPPPGGMLIALKDTNGDGHAEQIVRFGPTKPEGDAGGTGIALYKNYIYAETNDLIVRYALPSNGIAPTGKPETVVSGLPLGGDHPMHPMGIDANGNMYVDLGSATNSCQSQNRMPDVPGDKPCTELKTRGGTWHFDANKLGQRFSPAQRFATGLRNGEGISFDSAGRIFVTQHGRDQLWENWPALYKSNQGQNEPAEELVQERQGADFGWPECYYDYDQKKLVLAPEYGGDGGKKVGVCASKQAPVAAFPAHWAPNDMLIYHGSQFPTAYKDGAFLAFHGSWNRAPGAQGGYNVVFQPLADGKASGPFIVFADGFAGGDKQPGRAAHRPTGLAVGPDGALYIADDVGGRIWKVTFQGGNKTAGIAAAAPAPTTQQASASGNPLPPEGIHPNAGAPLPTPPGASPDQVALGERIFLGQADGGTCAGCHGTDGKGSEVGSNLASGHYLWSDGSVQGITQTIDHGVVKPKEHTGGMPPKGGVQLSQADVAAVADYVWALGHPSTH
ncbi:c-type cytochrome [Rhodopila sp.]|uniref:c-type cytochrome n=1 Tax=Rhodopila sp. TaxID=2480087 RepID=UPI003D14A3CB